MEVSDNVPATSDSQPASGKRPHFRFCFICLESVAPPGYQSCPLHWACTECLYGQLRAAIQPETKWPPKCCTAGHIFTESLDRETQDALRELDADFLAKYREREAEYRTPPQQRTYCSNGCGRMVDRNPAANARAFCSVCQKHTCTACKEPWKDGHFCSGRLPDLDVNYSSYNRVKRCPSCRQLIQLTQDCNHMVCSVCKNSFCWHCLEPYQAGESYPHHKNCFTEGDPEFDAQGYDPDGYHRDTGLDRQGWSRQGYDRNGLDRTGNPRRAFPAGLDDDIDDGALERRFARRFGITNEIRLQMPAGDPNPTEPQPLANDFWARQGFGMNSRELIIDLDEEDSLELLRDYYPTRDQFRRRMLDLASTGQPRRRSEDAPRRSFTERIGRLLRSRPRRTPREEHATVGERTLGTRVEALTDELDLLMLSRPRLREATVGAEQPGRQEAVRDEPPRDDPTLSQALTRPMFADDSEEAYYGDPRDPWHHAPDQTRPTPRARVVTFEDPWRGSLLAAPQQEPAREYSEEAGFPVVRSRPRSPPPDLTYQGSRRRRLFSRRDRPE